MERFELEKTIAEENVQEEKKHDFIKGKTKKKKKKLGGVRTMPFILGNEICDKFASVGFHSNFITYLTQVLNLPLVKASNTLTNFSGASHFTPIIGAFLADSFAGRFWTIIVGSIFYLLGFAGITISTILPQLHPPPCPSQTNCQEASDSQLWVLYAALLLKSIGTGGLRPCVVTFAADQIDMVKQKTDPKTWNFFNWYYFCLGMASLLALTVIVYIQDNVSWTWGLAVPTIAIATSVLAFILASSLYNKLKPAGSPYVRLAQVVVAAFKKRKLADFGALYINRDLDARISINGRLLHSNQFKWFDRAAVVTGSDDTSEPNPWRLSTVHRVEELKSLIRLLPISAAAIIVVASHSHLTSFTIQQARTMDRHLSHSFQIPPASMAIFNTLTVLMSIPMYDRVFVPFARRFTKNPSGITALQRMGIGYLISILASIVSALVEIKRKQAATNYNLVDKPTAIILISVFWLVPQYCLHGLVEVFMSIGYLEFLYDQSPDSMKSTAVALFWTATAMGNYASTLLVSLVHDYTGKKRNWLPDRNLNRGRLDGYYWLLTGIQVVNLVYYVVCARCYTYKPIDEITEIETETQTESGDGDVETPKDTKSLLLK